MLWLPWPSRPALSMLLRMQRQRRSLNIQVLLPPSSTPLQLPSIVLLRPNLQVPPFQQFIPVPLRQSPRCLFRQPAPVSRLPSHLVLRRVSQSSSLVLPRLSPLPVFLLRLVLRLPRKLNQQLLNPVFLLLLLLPRRLLQIPHLPHRQSPPRLRRASLLSSLLQSPRPLLRQVPKLSSLLCQQSYPKFL